MRSCHSVVEASSGGRWNSGNEAHRPTDVAELEALAVARSAARGAVALSVGGLLRKRRDEVCIFCFPLAACTEGGTGSCSVGLQLGFGQRDFEDSQSDVCRQSPTCRHDEPHLVLIDGIHVGWHDEVEHAWQRRPRPSDEAELCQRFGEASKVERMGRRHCHLEQVLGRDCSIDGRVVGFEKASILLRQETQSSSAVE